MNRGKNLPSYGSMASTSEVQFSGGGSPSFHNLCDNIVTNIYTINQSWKTLDNSYKSLGTSRDNQGLRDKIHVTQLSTNEIITVTSKNIHKLTLLSRKCDKQQKLHVEKLTDNFKEVIEKYSELQKQVAEKMKANLLVVASIENSTDDIQEQQQLQIVKEKFETGMLLDREVRIRQTEADIIDVNQIMRELSALINQQGEVIDTIENSIDYATGNVEEGTSELAKASNYQNKYRRKLLILVFIAFIVSAILVTILVTQLKR